MVTVRSKKSPLEYQTRPCLIKMSLMVPIPKKLTLFTFWFWLAMLFFLFVTHKNNDCVWGQATGKNGSNGVKSALDQW